MEHNLKVELVGKSFADIQHYFQAEILGLDLNLLDGSKTHQVQSYLTEIHKQLRLLSMDFQFWRSTSDLARRKSRQDQMLDRLDLLIRYCQAIRSLK